jgi:hypothetical protein
MASASSLSSATVNRPSHQRRIASVTCGGRWPLAAEERTPLLADQADVARGQLERALTL